MYKDAYGRSVEFLVCPMCDNSGYCEPNVVCPFAKIYGYHISDPDIAPPDDSFVFDDLTEEQFDMTDEELEKYSENEEARIEEDRRKNAEEWYRRRGTKPK